MKVCTNIRDILSIRSFRKCIIIYWALQHIRLLQITQFSIITYLIVIWAFFLFVYHRNKILDNIRKYYLPLFLFTGSYFITSLLNLKYSFVDNIQLIIWEFIQFFLMTCFSSNMKDNKEEIKDLMKLFIMYTFIFSLGSLIMFWLNINGIAIESGSGEEFRYGYRNGRLFGLYGSPNYGALFSVISIVFSVCILNKNRMYFGYINIIIQFLYLILSESRTGKVCFFLGAILICLWKYCNSKRLVTNRVLLNGILAGIFFYLMLLLCFEPIKKVNFMICNKIEIFQQNTERNSVVFVNNTKTNLIQIANDSLYTGKVNTPVNIQNSRDDLSHADISNGRISIWINAIKTFFISKPFFGVTQLGYMEYGAERFPDSYIIKNNKFSLHNDFITILTCSGMLGLGILGVFFLTYLRNIKIFIKRILFYKGNCMIDWTICTVLLMFLVTMFFSDAVILNITTESLMFWSFTGYLFTYVSYYRKNAYEY